MDLGWTTHIRPHCIFLSISTIRHVGEYMIRKARNKNKNLLVFAELFTGDSTMDAKFCKSIGINALVRETIHC